MPIWSCAGEISRVLYDKHTAGACRLVTRRNRHRNEFKAPFPSGFRLWLARPENRTESIIILLLSSLLSYIGYGAARGAPLYRGYRRRFRFSISDVFQSSVVRTYIILLLYYYHNDIRLRRNTLYCRAGDCAKHNDITPWLNVNHKQAIPLAAKTTSLCRITRTIVYDFIYLRAPPGGLMYAADQNAHLAPFHFRRFVIIFPSEADNLTVFRILYGCLLFFFFYTVFCRSKVPTDIR